MKQTDLNVIKNTAIDFLYIEPEPVGNLGNLFVTHPFINSGALMHPTEKRLFDLFDEPDSFNTWRIEYKKFLLQISNVSGIFGQITKPYRLTFFKYVNQHLSEFDYSKLLTYSYTSTEFPSRDVNVELKEIATWFRKADKKHLMNKEEYKKYCSFPNQIQIYRGVESSEHILGISWTLNLDTAKWFSSRFGRSESVIVKYVIDKNDIFAYFKGHNESEVIVDITKIDVNKIEYIKKEVLH